MANTKKNNHKRNNLSEQISTAQQAPQGPPQLGDSAMDEQYQSSQPMQAGQAGMMETEDKDDATRPYWMKTRIAGVKKISNKERRRRQNKHLRRLLTPKNALMVLNEMRPQDQIVNQFKVQATPVTYFKPTNSSNFCAELNLEGNTFTGFGENKMLARNNAAEQAIREIILKQLNKIPVSSAPSSIDGDSQAGQGESGDEDEEVLPMIQLASFALHKLFSEWESLGHRVPQLRPSAASAGDAPDATEEEGAAAGMDAEAGVRLPKKRAPRVLPANAASLHPCMVLTYMRANLDYQEAITGQHPHAAVFTVSVDVDGRTFTGTAKNKKEARRLAAKAACEELFGVRFHPTPTSNVPVLATP